MSVKQKGMDEVVSPSAFPLDSLVTQEEIGRVVTVWNIIAQYHPHGVQ